MLPINSSDDTFLSFRICILYWVRNLSDACVSSILRLCFHAFLSRNNFSLQSWIRVYIIFVKTLYQSVELSTCSNSNVHDSADVTEGRTLTKPMSRGEDDFLLASSDPRRSAVLGCGRISQVLKRGINRYVRVSAVRDRVQSKGDDNPALLNAGEFCTLGKNLNSEHHFLCEALPDWPTVSPQLSLNIAQGSARTSRHRATSFLFPRAL